MYWVFSNTLKYSVICGTFVEMIKKNLSRLLHDLITDHHGDYYFMNFLYLFRIENKLKPHEKLCRDHGCFCMVMLEKSNDILKYNQDKVNSRAQLIIYVYTESLLEKKA